MDSFPVVDPIPLPAPVWLFKLLHVVTLALHFITVEMMLGGLLVAVALTLMMRTPESRTAATAIARRLPMVMTYVINLGVPPLLFAQVLYGRALYTSSVLLGFWWIAVIPLLIACYWLLYRFAAALEAGRRAWGTGLMAWILAGAIAKIYSSNMTLMLRPEAWSGMYGASAFGVHLPQGDPALMLRWLFMLTGGLMFAGLWMLYLAGRSTFEANEKAFLARTGGVLAILGGALLLVAGIQVYGVQPATVQAGLGASGMYQAAAWTWIASVAVAILCGAAAASTRRVNAALSLGTPLVALLASASMTLYRDGIRDLTLLDKGFDVWQRTIVTNWSVVVLFLVLFVASLAVAGWLISVVARARKIKESMA